MTKRLTPYYIKVKRCCFLYYGQIAPSLPLFPTTKPKVVYLCFSQQAVKTQMGFLLSCFVWHVIFHVLGHKTTDAILSYRG